MWLLHLKLKQNFSKVTDSLETTTTEPVQTDETSDWAETTEQNPEITEAPTGGMYTLCISCSVYYV